MINPEGEGDAAARDLRQCQSEKDPATQNQVRSDQRTNGSQNRATQQGRKKQKGWTENIEKAHHESPAAAPSSHATLPSSARSIFSVTLRTMRRSWLEKKT